MATKSTENKKKKIVRKNIGEGAVHIQATFNNTIVTFTDAQGNAISWCSAGALGNRGAKKSTPFVAQQIVETAAKAAKEAGITKVAVYVKGAGGGREAAIRALATAEIGVTMIKDCSPIPHNGCRPPKRRRIYKENKQWQNIQMLNVVNAVEKVVNFSLRAKDVHLVSVLSTVDLLFLDNMVQLERKFLNTVYN